ncbi:MAG: hypothetical protein NZV14_03230 [Bryobacteraceae bacterium]|nr:hypothetical protein [Bryobacteraceae bacterium]MDW8377148.1 hypothetical protein [Bryobacterales bacterium]
MAASTNKKACIQRFDRETLYGYVSLSTCFQPKGVELLNLSGSLLLVPYDEVKAVCLVKEFEAPDPKEKRLFTTRPKSAGLWVRMRFKDGDLLDGLLANNLVLLDPYGFSVTPPDPSSNIQRVFVPKGALRELVVVAVVGSPIKPAARTKPKPPDRQISLFE